MPIAVQCPSCSARLNAPDAAAGRRVKCPKCQTPLLVPAAVADYEVVDDEPAPVAKAKAKPRVVEDEEDAPRPARKKSRVADDEEDEKPRPKSRAADDEEEEERPRKKSRRDRDDDDDDAPKKGRGKKGKRSALPLILGLLGGLVALGGGAFAVYWFAIRPPDTATTSSTPTTYPPKITGPSPDTGPPQPGPPIEMTADELAKGFADPDENKQRVELRKYAWKTVRLSGVVDYVGEPFVYLTTGVADLHPQRANSKLTVAVEFSGVPTPKLTRGTKVVAEVEVNGFGVGGPKAKLLRLISPEGGAPTEVKELLKVVITDGKMSINGTPIPSRPDLADLEKVLGKPSGVDDKSNPDTEVFWKAQGVSAAHDKGKTQLTKISFNFIGYYKVDDKTTGDPFPGSVTIDGVPVGKGMNAADLEGKLKVKKERSHLKMDLPGGGALWIYGTEVIAVGVIW